MAYGSDGLSASDVALLSGRTGNNIGDGAFGGNGAWWVIIFLIFAFVGWGRNGFGGNNGSNGTFPNGGIGAFDNYTLASDFATLQRQIDSSTATLERKADATQQGICDGFYAMNTGMLNGFAGVQNAMCQGFSGVNNSIMTSGYETRNAIQGVSSQLADCCCKTQSAIKDVNYNIATQTCGIQRSIDGVNYNMAMNTNSLQNSMCLNTRDIVDAVNNSYRSLHDEIVANRIEDKNAQIQAQQNEINALRLSASQSAQNTYLIDQLKPCPIPAYITCNPYQSYYPYNNSCCNSGCNCGNY